MAKLTGLVARCACGVFDGAMDLERTDRKEAGEILYKWFASGRAVEPRFGQWEEHLESCKCAGKAGSDAD